MKNYISNAKVSVRMFKNNLFEKLSKVHFIVPLLIFLPFIALAMYASLTRSGLSLGSQAGSLMAGLIC